MITVQNALRQSLRDTISDKRPSIANQIIDRFGPEMAVVEFFGGAVDALDTGNRTILGFEG